MRAAGQGVVRAWGRPDDDAPRRRFVGFADLADLERSLERRAPATDRRARGAGPAAPAADTRELCHDLRQQVAAATALVRTLGDEPHLTDAGRDRLRAVQGELAQLSELIDGSLTPPEPAPVGLAELARRACRTTDASARAQVDLVVAGEPVVLGDPVLLTRLTSNLLANARHAAGPDGHVRAVVAVWRGQGLLQVDDAGGGTSAGVSHGLGLLIVQSLVARHGGTVDSRPSDLGGLRVRVALPLAGQRPRAGEAR